MKRLAVLFVLMTGLLLISCSTTEHSHGPVMSENDGIVDWVFPDNKKYGVIRVNDDKWFPYYDEFDQLRWNDIVFNVPQYGDTSTHVKITGNNSTSLYLYEHKLSRHRAVSYIRMITIFGESSSDRQ